MVIAAAGDDPTADSADRLGVQSQDDFFVTVLSDSVVFN